MKGDTERVTVFGADGFIGKNVADYFGRKGFGVSCVTRHNWPVAGSHLGHCIYAIGLTSDFRQFPLRTMEAHVTLPVEIIDRYKFDSVTYLSSTRVYKDASKGEESQALTVDPANPDDVYNLSKLAGETMCLNAAQGKGRVLRLSNVFGPGDASANFLAQITHEAATTGRVTLRTSENSKKDYIALGDAILAICNLVLHGDASIYNVASGISTTNKIISNIFQEYGIEVTYATDAVDIIYPDISIKKMTDVISFSPQDFGLSFKNYWYNVKRRVRSENNYR